MGYPHRRGQPISFLTTNNQSLIIHIIMAQMLAASGNKLFYYTWPKDATHNYEIDFLLSRGAKIHPIEVKRI